MEKKKKKKEKRENGQEKKNEKKCVERVKKTKKREGFVQLCYQNLSQKYLVFAANMRSSGSSHTEKWFTLYQEKAEKAESMM